MTYVTQQNQSFCQANSELRSWSHVFSYCFVTLRVKHSEKYAFHMLVAVSRNTHLSLLLMVRSISWQSTLLRKVRISLRLAKSVSMQMFCGIWYIFFSRHCSSPWFIHLLRWLTLEMNAQKMVTFYFMFKTLNIAHTERF